MAVNQDAPLLSLSLEANAMRAFSFRLLLDFLTTRDFYSGTAAAVSILEAALIGTRQRAGGLDAAFARASR